MSPVYINKLFSFTPPCPAQECKDRSVLSSSGPDYPWSSPSRTVFLSLNSGQLLHMETAWKSPYLLWECAAGSDLFWLISLGLNSIAAEAKGVRLLGTFVVVFFVVFLNDLTQGCMET